MSNDNELFAGQRVYLVSFDGQANSQSGMRDDENYWKLIGSNGIISEFGTDVMSDRVLVTFDDNPAELGLACHNPIPKSLWIKTEDLRGSNWEK